MAVLESGLSEVVADDEPLARFATESSKFNSSGAKPALFIPPSCATLSVGRQGPEPMEDLITLAREYLPESKVYGAAILTARQVRDVELRVEADEPPRRHANVLGWPESPDIDERKARWKLKAVELANRSSWCLFRD